MIVVMDNLKDHLGLWKHDRLDKYYSVVPNRTDGMQSYKINWTTPIKSDTKALYVSASAALSRILSKQRAGYRLVVPYTGECPESASISIGDLPISDNPLKVSKPKPDKDKFNLLEWLGGREYPDD